MTNRQVCRVNQQSKGKTPLVSGVLQRAAVRAVADKEGEATQEVESGRLRESRFVHDFSQVPIDRGRLPKEVSETPNQTGLPDNLKAGVESLSGYSLNNVRVHYNSPKPAQLQALAYTQGTEIHVAPGQQEYLPHEAWHVVQQMQGRVKPTMQMKGVQINDDEGLEREADVMGGKAMTRRERAGMRSTTQLQASPKAVAPLQLLHIAKLNLDTKTASNEQLVKALQSSDRPLTNWLGDFEARAILNRFAQLATLEGFDIPDRLREDLQEVADFWDHDPADDDTTDQGKVKLAGTLVKLLNPIEGGLKLILSGGGAVALRGGKRAIKDLDFRTILPPHISFRPDNAEGTKVIKQINEKLAIGHHIDPLEVQDEETGYTIKGEVDGLEVSITRTPLVEYSHEETVAEVPILTKLDLLWDKAYSFMFRREFEKQITDLYDLAVVLALDGKQGRMYAQAIKYGGLNIARGKAYESQAAKRRGRGQELDKSPVKELRYKLADVFEDKQKIAKVYKYFRESNGEELIEVLNNFGKILSS